MNDLCPICRGSGHHFVRLSPFEVWRCIYCDGAGVRIQYGPAMFKKAQQ